MHLPERDEASVRKPSRSEELPLPAVERERVYLYPADMHVATRPTEVTTVLGSCVAVTVWCPRRGRGGIIHALLPEAPVDATVGEELRFVDSALGALVRSFGMSDEQARRELVVKAFGGAAVGPSPLDGRASSVAVGRRNVEILQRELVTRGIELASYDVGGRHGRKLRFLTDTGDVFMKRLERSVMGRS